MANAFPRLLRLMSMLVLSAQSVPVFSQSRWVDYDIHAGTGQLWLDARQVPEGVEQLDLLHADFGTILSQSSFHFGLGATYKLSKSSVAPPMLHVDLDFIHHSYSGNFSYFNRADTINVQNPFDGYVFHGNTGGAINALRFAPALRLQHQQTRALNFYTQFGPSYLLVLRSRSYERGFMLTPDEHAAFIRTLHNVVSLSAETGVGFRDFSMYVGYDYGLTKYAYGSSYWGPLYDFKEKYRALRIGLSYHPGLTRRLRQVEESQRRRNRN